MTTQTTPHTPDVAGTWQLDDSSVNRAGSDAMPLTEAPPSPAPPNRGAVIALLRRAVELGTNRIEAVALDVLPARWSKKLICRELSAMSTPPDHP